MPSTRRLFLIACAALALTGCTGFGITSNVPTGTTTPQQLSQASILSAINEARRINGNHKPLTYNPELEAACRFQADLMAKKDTLAHDVGYTLRERTDMQGYRGAVGENIAGGQTSLQQAIEGWLNSPGHRATLLSDKFVEFGLAEAHTAPGVKSRYGNYWCFIAGGPVEAWMAGTGVTPPKDDGLQVTGGVAGSVSISG